MEGESSVKTVDCLRGRLLAERLASRNAKEETEQLENKLMELEKMLKQEAKSRNRAEKRLKFLCKKLESKNISHGSEYSGLVGKSDISSPSSTDSLETQETERSEQGPENNNLLQKNNSPKFLFSLSDDNSSAIEVSSSSLDLSDNFEEKNSSQDFIVESLLYSQKSHLFGFDQNCDDSQMNEQSDVCYHSFGFLTEDAFNKEENDDQDDKSYERNDNSTDLGAVDHCDKNRCIDQEVLDSAVKEVLDALKRAKEQLQSSIDKRRGNMIRVG